MVNTTSLSYYNINLRRYEPDALNSIMKNNNCMLRGIFGKKNIKQRKKKWENVMRKISLVSLSTIFI